MSRFLVLFNTDEAFGMIKRNQHVFDDLTPRTFDLTTSYTKLSLVDIAINTLNSSQKNL